MNIADNLLTTQSLAEHCAAAGLLDFTAAKKVFGSAYGQTSSIWSRFLLLCFCVFPPAEILRLTGMFPIENGKEEDALFIENMETIIRDSVATAKETPDGFALWQQIQARIGTYLPEAGYFETEETIQHSLRKAIKHYRNCIAFQAYKEQFTAKNGYFFPYADEAYDTLIRMGYKPTPANFLTVYSFLPDVIPWKKTVTEHDIDVSVATVIKMRGITIRRTENEQKEGETP